MGRIMTHHVESDSVFCGLPTAAGAAGAKGNAEQRNETRLNVQPGTLGLLHKFSLPRTKNFTGSLLGCRIASELAHDLNYSR